MKVFIGTRNPVKVAAVEAAFREFFDITDIIFIGLDVSSMVSPQPIGIDTVIAGAVNRAKNALEEGKTKLFNNIKSSEQIFGVGIEAGLVQTPHTITGYLDFQYCVIIDNLGHQSIGAGPGWEYPPEVTQTVVREPDLEIGTVMAKISGDPKIKFHNGAIGFYSNGHLQRPEITKDPVRMALIPFINMKEYFNQ
jgi:inosine/xanthosine triphosphatase